MYEEDRENREDRDQEIERTEIMDDVDEQETQTSSSRSQENRKSGSSQNVNWTTREFDTFPNEKQRISRMNAYIFCQIYCFYV